ncbi:MAG TPA: NTP transferase domain-containing protein [Roseovarius sp.]
MYRSLALIVLGTGTGTRMNSDLPKVLHAHSGRPDAGPSPPGGRHAGARADLRRHGPWRVEAAALEHDPDIRTARQAEQLGTAHAVAQARAALEVHDGDTIVLYGDTPFIRPETLERMIEARGDHDMVVLGFDAADPGRYGGWSWIAMR